MTSELAASRLFRSPLLVTAVFAILACGQRSPDGAARNQAAVISDQVHGGGTPGFFWLPPIAPAVDVYGTFAPGLAPVVEIEKLPLGSAPLVATFTTAGGPHAGRVKSDGTSQYMVDWDTKASSLDSGAVYRVRVSVEGLELGFVDVKVIDDGSGRKEVLRDAFLPLVNGRTLPIKFRIDDLAVRCVGVVCTALDQCHAPGGCDVHTGQCTNPTKPDGTPCDDHSVCTTVDTCTAGVCSGPPLDCNDGNGCTYDGCNPVEGCVYVHQYGPSCAEPAPPEDVTIADFQLANGPFRPNQAVNLSVTLDAAADHPDYMMEFVLFPADDPSPYRAATLLHSTYFKLVPAGTSQTWIPVTIPADLAPGRYVLLAHEYSDGPFVRGVSQQVVEIGAAIELPVLDAVEYLPDSQALLVDAESTIVDAGVHLNYPVAGTFEVVARNYGASDVPVRAYVKWNGNRVPLQIWDAGQGRYVEQLLVTLVANEPTSVLVEAALLESDAAAIRAALSPLTPSTADVELTLNESGVVDEASCVDPITGPAVCVHSLIAPAMLFAAPPSLQSRSSSLAALAGTTPLVYQKSYNKFAEIKSFVGAGVDFSGKAALAQNGFDGRATAKIPARIFGNDFEFAGASATALAPIDAAASFAYDFRLVGVSLASDTITGANVALPALDLFSVTKEISYSWLIIVYCVPVDIVLGARGTIDVTGHVTASSTLAQPGLASLDLSVVPHGNVSAFGAAGVGVQWHGFDLGAYLDVVVALVDTHFTASAGGALDIVIAPPKRTLRGSLHETLQYDLGFGGGAAKVVVYFPSIGFCGPWYAPHPCLSGHWTKEKTLFQWKGYTLPTQTFLDKQQTGFELALADCTSCASAGAQCGTVPSNCGGTIDCGGCAAGQACVGNACIVCAPTTCAQAGAQCGLVTNNCGQTFDCGACAPGTGCVANQCVPCGAESCAAAGAACGTFTNQCGVTYDCGSCGAGETCQANACYPTCQDVTVYTHTYTEESILGVSEDYLVPSNPASCGAGYHRGTCSATKTNNTPADHSHCEASWKYADPNDCTCAVHLGAVSGATIVCDVLVTKLVDGCVYP